MKDDQTDNSAVSVEGEAIEDAVRRAVRRALISHKKNGNPVVFSRSGEVDWVEAQDIIIPEEPAAKGA
jgi:hypothetical protein